jgi:hypothetical protein
MSQRLNAVRFTSFIIIYSSAAYVFLHFCSTKVMLDTRAVQKWSDFVLKCYFTNESINHTPKTSDGKISIFFPEHTMKAHEREEVKLHSILFITLDWAKLWASRFGSFILGGGGCMGHPPGANWTAGHGDSKTVLDLLMGRKFSCSRRISNYGLLRRSVRSLVPVSTELLWCSNKLTSERDKPPT